MASLANDPNGRKRISFAGRDARRHSLRLGKVTKRFAEGVQNHVEHILHSQKTGQSLPVETSDWIAAGANGLARQLGAVGLMDYRVKATTLGAMLAAYLTIRGKVKPATAKFYGHTIRNLIAFFGADKPLGDITFIDAERFRQWLADVEKLEDATIRRRCSLARQFFTFAVDDRLVADNPFRKLRGIGVKANRTRDYFLSPADAAKVLDACPDSEWRLIFALARWGGLRTPSETLALRWADVDWTAAKITIRQNKTKERVIPLFPELRPRLEDCFDPTAEFVISRERFPSANLGVQMARYVTRAGLTPWPKLFQNLRATRETELAEVFPIHVVCEWIGNSQIVAKKHYLQVTEKHFAKAARKAAHQARSKRIKGVQS